MRSLRSLAMVHNVVLQRMHRRAACKQVTLIAVADIRHQRGMHCDTGLANQIQWHLPLVMAVLHPRCAVVLHEQNKVELCTVSTGLVQEQSRAN